MAHFALKCLSKTFQLPLEIFQVTKDDTQWSSESGISDCFFYSSFTSIWLYWDGGGGAISCGPPAACLPGTFEEIGLSFKSPDPFACPLVNDPFTFLSSLESLINM